MKKNINRRKFLKDTALTGFAGFITTNAVANIFKSGREEDDFKKLTLAKANEKKTNLRFNSNGEFKILQFTDTHVSFEGRDAENLGIFKYLDKIIQIEKPDLVMLTGDIASKDYTQKVYPLFLEVFVKHKVKWAAVLGNHDSKDVSNRNDIAKMLEGLPYCMNTCEAENIAGSTNFILPVYGKSEKTEALLYCMDTHSYSTMEPKVKGYAWFDISQINWYMSQSKQYTSENGKIPLPALAFFHIPLPEYDYAWNEEKISRIGEKREKICCPDINTGMFSAMLMSGDVMGTFVGHDHNNDFLIEYYNIALTYGRTSKLHHQDNPVLAGRVIVLKEGERSFDTWIRDLNGKKDLEYRYSSHE